jgi:hypothetical protein
MRVGTNPEKSNLDIELKNYHRVVVPVYIPNFDGYFKEQFEIFKLCLESLLLTIHKGTKVTIYNNASHKDVKKYIASKYQESEAIDQVFHSDVNMGKINAILAAVKGNIEPLITITDADVLFKNGWQEAVEDVFLNFPYAGMVSPVPSSKAWGMHTCNNWYYGLLNNNLRFSSVMDPIGMKRFDDSLGNKTKLYNQIHLETYLTHTINGTPKAVMGCGHFVATLKREVFDKGSDGPAFKKIHGGVEGLFIDEPNQALGYLRLATLDNYAFHMGNTVENWMYEEFKKLKLNLNSGFRFKTTKSKSFTKIQKVIGFLILKILVKFSLIRSLLFRLYGLKNARFY